MHYNEKYGKPIYKSVFTSNESFLFDEQGKNKNGIVNLFDGKKLKLYAKINIIADISVKYNNLIISTADNKKNGKYIFEFENENNSTLYGYYKLQGELMKKEYMYIHLQKRKMLIKANNHKSFLIIPNEIVDKNKVKLDNKLFSKLNKKVTIIRKEFIILKMQRFKKKYFYKKKENDKKRILARRIYHRVLGILPKKCALKLRYRTATHKKLDLKNPKDFNEKIFYLLAYKYGDKEKMCADKFRMRDYVAKKGLENYLPKLYSVYSDARDIDFNKLPESYVLKPNNGCGGVFINTPFHTIDRKVAIKTLNKAMKTDYGKLTLEYQYRGIKPLIICEEYLNDGKCLTPNDYKFYCTEGEAKCILVCTERDKSLKLDYYDINWNKLKPQTLEKYRSEKIIPKPKNLNKMIEIANKLSEGFPFVRIDLYDINGKIYIGEMTFTPSGAILSTNTQESLDYLGSLIKI